MLVKILGVNAFLPLLCRLRCSKSFNQVIKFKVGDYSLIIHKSACHLFSVFISNRGFSSLQTRKSFGEILSGNHRFLRPSIRLVTSYNSAYLITSFTFLRKKILSFDYQLLITNNRLALLLSIGSDYV